MSKKYNEIMDKVVVTDEMRRRVLKEISSADPEKLAAYKIDADEDFANVLSSKKRFPAAKILAGLAVACALILIAGIIRIGQPLMSPSMTGSVEYEEAKEYAAEEAEEDTMVGNAGAKSEDAEDGTAGAADRPEEAVAEDSTSDRVDMSVRLSEPEIRKIVETYMGSEYEISNTDIEESVLIYTVSRAQSGEAFSHIRIDLNDGNVEIENIQTGEISTLTFREMTGQ